jgi:hypothetical protein
MRYEIKRIDIWSIVKIVFLLSLLGGFIIGVFYAAIIGFISSMSSTMGGDSFTDALGVLGGVALIFIVVFCTIFFAVFYTVLAAIGAALYNLFSRWAGGITLELMGKEPVNNPTQLSNERVL